MKKVIDKVYQIVIRKTTICPAGKTVIAMIDALPEGGHVQNISLLGEEKNGKIPVYIDTVDQPNMYGQIVSVSNGEETLEKDDLDDIRDAGNYEIVLTSRDGNMISGEFRIMKSAESANTASKAETTSELEALIEEKIALGYVTREDMAERMQVFAANRVDPFLLKRIISNYRLYNKPTHRPSTIYQDPYIEQSIKLKEEGIISEGLRAAVSRNAIICEGEKSVGKNVYLETVAWLMNMPMYLITFTRQMSPSSIYGEKTTDNSAAQALAEFDPQILAKADDLKREMQVLRARMQGKSREEINEKIYGMFSDEERHIMAEAERFEKLKAQSASVNIVIDSSELYDWLVDGGLMCFNEMNMAEANFFASFANQLLDGTGFLFIPGRGEVTIHKDCVLFGTQNADYAGTEQQNEATMSRFGCIYFKQPESIKKQLVAAVTSALKKDGFDAVKLENDYYKQAESFYKQCRNAVTKDIVSNACLNIRGFVRALTAVAESDGIAKLKRQIEINVINTCPFDERQSLKTVAEQIVTL